jgi:hypothetical protein
MHWLLTTVTILLSRSVAYGISSDSQETSDPSLNCLLENGELTSPTWMVRGGKCFEDSKLIQGTLEILGIADKSQVSMAWTSHRGQALSIPEGGRLTLDLNGLPVTLRGESLRRGDKIPPYSATITLMNGDQIEFSSEQSAEPMTLDYVAPTPVTISAIDLSMRGYEVLLQTTASLSPPSVCFAVRNSANQVLEMFVNPVTSSLSIDQTASSVDRLLQGR